MTPGRLVVFGDDLTKAAGVAFGALDHALAVAFRFLIQPRRRAARPRNHVVGIGLAFVLLALAVLPGFHRVVECRLHLLRRLRILHRHLADADTGLVAIEDLLHQLLRACGHLRPALVQHEVHGALADDLADRGFGGLQHAFVRETVIEQIILGILQHILHRELDID